MRLSDLPNDILTLILEQLLRRNYNGVDFKANLALAAIDRQLRHVAIPLIYREAYCCFDSNQFNHQNPRRGASRGNEPEAEPSFGTNVDAIASAGCASLVRHVNIWVCGAGICIEQMLMALAAFREASPEWPKVQRLGIRGFLPELNSSPARNRALYSSGIQMIDRSLAALMPNIHSLRTWGCVDAEPLQTLLQILVDSRRDQLQMIWPRLVMDPQLDTRLTQISYLRIDHQRHNEWVDSRIELTTLYKLCITNIHADYPWAGFRADSNSQSIEFPALEDLRLSFTHRRSRDQSETDQAGQLPKLLFPSLQTVGLKNVGRRCPFLDRAVFPPLLERFELSVSLHFGGRITDVALPAARIMVIHVGGSPFGAAKISPGIQRFQSGTHHNEVTYMNLHRDIDHFDIDFAFGTWLTELTVQAVIRADVMLAVVGSLPRLARLSARCERCSTLQTDISLPRPSKGNHPVQPLSTSVKWLFIGVCRERTWCKQLTALVKFLLLKIPSLVLLDMTGATNARHKSLNKSYGRWYPHLSTVKVVSTETFPN